jgi:hypothetical protein
VLCCLAVFLLGFVECEQFCAATTSPKVADAEARIQRFLESSPTCGVGKFHVQGWRWHTMSLIREAARLQKLALKFEQQGGTSSAFMLAAEYTVEFNMKGLHKIETELFLPWVRKKARMIDEQTTAIAFDVVLDQLERDRRKMEELGVSLVRPQSACVSSP